MLAALPEEAAIVRIFAIMRLPRAPLRLVASSACSGTPTLASRLRGRCAIAVGKSRRRGLAANDLAADGGRTEAELVCDLAPTTSGLKQQLDRDAIGLAQMRVVSSHLRDTLQDARCRTSTLSRPASPMKGVRIWRPR